METAHATSTGKIVQIIGPVLDVDFSASGILPKIYDALTINFEVSGTTVNLKLEVQQHLGEGLVRAIAMSSTEGLKRGMEVINTGEPIQVPVGEAVLGRVFNVTGRSRRWPWDPSMQPRRTPSTGRLPL